MQDFYHQQDSLLSGGGGKGGLGVQGFGFKGAWVGPFKAGLYSILMIG